MNLCKECLAKFKRFGSKFKTTHLCKVCKQKHNDGTYLLNRKIEVIYNSEFEVFKIRPLKSPTEVEQQW